jgi:hypothetical protein
MESRHFVWRRYVGNSSARYVIPILAIASLWLLNGEYVTAADGNDEMSKIEEHWRSRQVEFRSLRFVLTGDSMVPKGHYSNDPEIPESANKVIPPEDTTFPKESVLWIDFERHLIRKETREHIYLGNSQVFAPHRQIDIFDGKEVKSFEPRDENRRDVYSPSARQPELWINKDLHLVLDKMDSPVFWSAGYVPARMSRELFSGSQRSVPLHYYGKGTNDNREVVVLRTAQAEDQFAIFDEYWVDIGRRSAIVKFMRYLRGKINVQIDVVYDDTLSGWLPASWTLTENGLSPRNMGKVIRSAHFTVKERTINSQIPPDAIQVQSKPGMIVGDAKSVSVYRTQPDGISLLDITREPLEQASSGAWRGIWIWALLPLIGLLALILWSRFWRRRQDAKV